eukprot:CAMPEP_0204904082 /NCGR_PEP_ID=MMETSP1397-20131031/4655_1 /ASSEMBLY_ACC=CAM_ASM_000891 /TAXON_ID=49980 /ORGANISM="Climacostomum Climacostomum virens, Strain Stock W-24" /LENGTH=305 /DNA_ID=CAMNT_0052072817 /DNA_START=10 /DNA_END=927 /DNA_ORIENTATION=+
MSLRIGVLGCRDSGKTTLVETIKTLVNSKKEIWDDITEFRYSEALEKQYHMLIIMYDVTQPQTFYKALDMALNVRHLPRILIGNKADLSFRKIRTEQKPADICLHYDVPYREISAFSVTDVEDIGLTVTEIASAQKEAQNKCVIRVSNRCYTRLKSICHLLSCSSILEGLIVVCYGMFLSLWLDEGQAWFGDSMMISGLVTFFMSFLGYYGLHYNRCKEYVNVYLTIILANFIMKLIIFVLVYSDSVDIHTNVSAVLAYHEFSDLSLLCLYCIINDSVIITFNFIERLADKAKTQSDKIYARVGF